MKIKEKYILTFLLALILSIRLYHVNIPPLENEESWRQADTESMAWNFADYDFNPLHPNLNYDGPLPNIPALELQVTTYLIAVLYKLFGHHYFLARIVPIVFFLISSVFLYLLARRHLSMRGAVLVFLFMGSCLLTFIIRGLLCLNPGRLCSGSGPSIFLISGQKKSRSESGRH
jgi:4-amino-4-deoxy-L-arabinose transferase-like glycosyltransferase